MFCHPGSLDIRPVAEISTKLRLYLFLRKRQFCPLFFCLILHHGNHVFHLFLDIRICMGSHMFFPKSLIPAHILMTANHYLLFRDRLHGFGIKFDSIDWLHIGTSPVKIHTPIIINEQIWIPERECGRNSLKGLCPWISCPMERTILPISGRGKIHIISHNTNIRCIIINGDLIS